MALSQLLHGPAFMYTYNFVKLLKYSNNTQTSPFNVTILCIYIIKNCCKCILTNTNTNPRQYLSYRILAYLAEYTNFLW